MTRTKSAKSSKPPECLRALKLGLSTLSLLPQQFHTPIRSRPTTNHSLPSPLILIAEDDPSARAAIADALESDGHAVRLAADGAEALALAAASPRPDLVLLDIMMPKRSGYEVCTELRRADPLLPILFLTAKATEADAVLGLGLGADDYIAKPFGVDELLARVRAALRRASAVPPPPAAAAPFPFGPYTVDPARYALRAPSSPDIPLTDRELGLLRLFAARPNEVLTRDALLDALWGVHYAGTTRTLDQHIAQLRRKLGPAAPLLSTVHGLGYRYTPDGSIGLHGSSGP